jgi:hypothetical protein
MEISAWLASSSFAVSKALAVYDAFERTVYQLPIIARR